MENMKTVSVQIPEETYRRLNLYLSRRSITRKDLVTRLIEAALEKDNSAPQDTK